MRKRKGIQWIGILTAIGMLVGSFVGYWIYAEEAKKAEEAEKATLQSKEDYQIAEGEVYVYGASDTKYSNTAEKNAITQAVEAILKANKTEAIIVVGEGTYEGGIEIEYKKDKPLKLSIVAEDSFEKVEKSDSDSCIPTKTTTEGENTVTTYEYKAISSGGVVVMGGIQTKNVSLTLAGIHLGNTLKESIEDVNSLDIDVTGGAGFTYYGTTLADKVNVSLTHVSDSVTIDLGAGNDTLDFKLVKAPTETLTYKSVYNDVTSDDWVNDITNTIQTKLGNILEPDQQKITITGGAGNDTISSNVMNSSDITIDDTEGLSLLMDVTPIELSIDAGSGADRVSVSGGIAMNSLKTIALQVAYNALYSLNSGYESTIQVDLGAGDDYCDVLSTISYISFGTAECNVEGKEGYDHINIDGKLGAKSDSAVLISGDSSSLQLATMAEVSIFEAATVAKIYGTAVLSLASETITDTLSGKKEVTVYQKDGALYKQEDNTLVTPESFTNYVVENYDSSKAVQCLTGESCFLTNLVIEGDTELSLGNMNVPYLTLLANVEDSGINSDITLLVDGTIQAKNLLIRAENSDSHSLAIISSDLDSDSDTEIEASCFDVTSSITVEISSKSEITVTQVFDVLISSTQTQGLLPTASGLSAGTIPDDGTNPNFVVVKTADVNINVYGKITAAGIRMEANSNVETESQNQALKDFGIPVAVGVVCTNANIEIDSKEITSTNGITILAKSEDSLGVTAMTGLLPFTLSTAVVVNNAHVDVIGTSDLNAGGDIVLLASSDVITRTISTGTCDGSKLVTSSKVDTSASGGFFTVSVVLSDVHAEVSENSKITTKGSLYVLSDSLQDIVNQATSNPESEGDSKSLVDIVDDLKDVFTKAKKNPIFTKKNAQEAFTKVINKLTGNQTGVTNLFDSSTSGAEEAEEASENTSTSNTQQNTTKKESGKDQLVGALAVTYTDNDNQALFDTTGAVSITGTAVVKSNGSISILTLADGSPVKRTSKASGSDNKEEVEKPEEKETKAITNGIVEVTACENGTVTLKNDSEDGKDIEAGHSVIIKIEAESGYKIKSCVIKEEGKKDDTPSNVVGKTSAEFSTVFDKKATITVVFEEKEIELVCENTDTSLYTLTAYSDSSLETITAHADKGEKVYVSAKCKGGVSLKSIQYKYQKNGATIKGTLEKSNGVYSLTLPKGSYYTITFTAEVELTELSLETKEVGSVSGNKVDFYDSNRKSILKANVGDKVTLEIVCVDGSYLKKDGLKLGDEVLPVKVEGSTYSTELTIKYMKSTPDEFKVNVEFTSKESEAEGYTAKKTALGVGINVNVTTYSNISRIDLQGTSIQVGGFDVEANTAKHDVEAIAKAGFTAADFGLAGTVTVNVVSSNTLADLLASQKVTMEDSSAISVKSGVSGSKIVTIADAGGVDADGTSSSDDGIGVGAGIGVQVVGVDVISTVYTENIEAKTQDLGALSVSSSFGGKEKLLSKAGASGGKAVVPVLSLDVSGVYVESNVMMDENSYSEDVEITSSNEMERELTADAQAVGAKVAAGGSFVISVLNDSALTTVDASITSDGNITTTSSSTSQATLEAKAGANGAKPDESSDKEGSEKNLSDENARTDATVNSNLEGAGKIANTVNSKNTNEANVTDAKENRQKAETSEGNVSVAASVTVNVMENQSITEIADGSALKAKGGTSEDDNGIIVNSTIDTDAVISANSSTANSGKGIAVGVAVNVVNYDNKVILGKGTYETEADFIVKAIINDKELEDKTAELVTDLVNKLLEVFSAEQLANVLVCDEKDTFKEYVEAIALELDFTTEELSTKLEDGSTSIMDSLVAAIVERIKCSIKDEQFEETVLEEYQTLVEEVMIRLIAKFKNGTAINNIISKSNDIEKIFTDVKKNTTDKEKWKEVLNSALTALAYMLGSDDELDGVGSKISTTAISGAGAAEVGVAGSVAISVVNADTYTILSPGSTVAVDGNFVLNADAAQTMFTTSTASVNREGKADKNKTTTDASASSNNGATSNSAASTKDSKKSVGVGASVAIAFGDVNVYSGVGYNVDLNDSVIETNIKANTLDIRAVSRNDADTIAVAGSDPLAAAENGKEEKVRNDIAVDASVAVAILNNNVHGFIGEESKVVLGSDNSITNPVDDSNKVNGLVYVKEGGSTLANASGYAVGGQTAVGAAVAVNLALSDVDVLIDGSIYSNGSVVIVTESLTHDDAKALALAMGADMDRYTDKMNQMKVLTQKKEQANASKSSDNTSKEEVKTSTSTGDKIADNLNKNSSDNSTKADSSKSLSESVLQSENVKTESVQQTEDDDLNAAVGNLFGDDTEKEQTKEEKKDTLSQLTDGGNNKDNDNTSSDSAKPSEAVSSGMNGDNVSEDAKKSKNITIAAAVGVNITNHSLLILVNGKIQAGNITISSVDNGNFATVSSGAAVSMAENSNSIGAAVAVSVNHNKSIIEIEKDLESSGNIDITSDLKANLDGTYAGKYGALAIAGAASGKGGSATVAGAITVMVADTTTMVVVADNVKLTAKDDISILSKDKTKLNTGAIAATLSKGTTVGVGAAFALLYAENEVITDIGATTTIQGNRVDIKAIKEKVTIKDYNSPFKAAEILTIKMDTTEVTDSDGIFVVTEKDGKYDVTVNVQTDDISTAAQLTSALGTGNYSALAIAGTIVGSESSSKAAVAGSVSMLFDTSNVCVVLHDNANVSSTGDDISIIAGADNNGILIGGAASVSSATAGVGVNAGIVVSKDSLEVLFGNNVIVKSNKNIDIEAKSDNELVAVSIAAAVSGSGAKATIGGGITVIVSKNVMDIDTGKNCQFVAVKDVTINATNDSNMDVISVSVGLQKSETGAVAVGGTVDVIVGKNKILVAIGENNTIEAKEGELNVSADNTENLISVLGSVSAASQATAAAATVDVLVTSSEAILVVGSDSKLSAEEDVNILSTGRSRLIGVQLAAAVSGSKGPAVGATVLVNVFNRELSVTLNDSSSVVSKSGSVVISAEDNEETILVSIDAAVSTGSTSVAGNIQVNVGRSKVHTEIGSNSYIEAKNNVAILANLNAINVQVAPSASVSLGSVGVGATVVVTVLRDYVEAITMDKVTLIANIADSSDVIAVPEKGETKNKRGIILSSNIYNTTVMCGIGVGVSSGVAVSGVIDTLVVRNTCYARMGSRNKATVGGTSDDLEGDSCGLIIEANDNSFLLNFGGAVSAAATTGVGATVVTLVFDSEVEAEVGLDTNIESSGVVIVKANDDYNLYLVGVSFSAGLSGASIGAGGSVLIFGNKTHAIVDGNITAIGNISILANAKSELLNASASVAVNNVAVSGSAVVTYLEGETIAVVKDNRILHSNRDIYVSAISNESIVTEGLGVSGAPGAAVSGVVDVMVNGIVTKAITGEYVEIRARDLFVEAKDSYDLDAIAASVALAGTAGVGVTAVVTVAKNTVVASLGENNKVVADTVDITANSDRRVLSVAGTVGVGATAGVGATVMVTVIGSQLDEDSSEAIHSSFDREAFMKDMSENSSAASSYYKNRDLSELEGSGVQASGITVGSPNENGSYEYSATDGYDTSKSTYTPGTNKDQENAENISLGMNKLEKTDSTIVSVGANSSIKGKKSVQITANDNLVIDAVTASVAGGGFAGVGVGVAVAISNSNVFAFVHEGVSITTKKFDLSATGMSKGDSVNEDIQKSYKDVTAEDITDPSIHVISASAAASGTAAVGVAVAVVSLTSDIEAVFNGYRLVAEGASIVANSLYDGIVAATLGFGVGNVAVSASVAVVDYSGYTLSSISSSALMNVDTLAVETNAQSTVETIAAAIAGGGVAVNGGVSVAIQQNTSETYIYQGATIVASGEVHVLNNTIANANAYLIGASVGAIDVALSAGVSIVEPVILTYVGSSPQDMGRGQKAEKKGSITASAVIVENAIQSNSETTILSLAGGAIAVNGNALLVFNDMIAYASIQNMNITTDSIDVHSDADVKGKAQLASVTVGAIAVGISVSYVGLDYINYAVLVYDDVTIETKSLQVTAGTSSKHNAASAIANTLVANSGAVSANLNAAITDNNATNKAYCYGTGSILVENEVDVDAYLDAISNTKLSGLSELTDLEVSGISVNAGTSIAINRSTNEAYVSGNFNTNTIHVCALINENMESAKAELYQGQAFTAVAITASVAVAYAQMNNQARFVTTKTVASGDIHVLALGKAEAVAKTGNLNEVSGVAGAVLVSYSYSTATFISELSAKKLSAYNLNVKANYDSLALSEVTPSKGGAIDISLGTVKTNLAIAESTSTGIVRFDSSSDVIVTNDLVIGIEATGNADAKVNSVVFEAKVVKVTTNVSNAIISDILHVDIHSSKVLKAKNFDVHSVYNGSSTNGAKAIVGGNDISNISGSVSFVDVTTNVAEAKDTVTNEITVEGNPEITAKNDVRFVANTFGNAEAKTKSSTISTSAASIGNMYTNSVIVDNTSMNLSLGRVVSKYGSICAMVNSAPQLISIADAPTVTVSGISEASVNAAGSIGEEKNKASALLNISSGDLYANNGDIILEAVYNPTKNTLGVTAGTNVSILTVQVNSLETKTYAKSAVEIGNDVSLHATKASKTSEDGSNITILSEVLPVAKLSSSSANIGIALAVSDLEIKNTTVTEAGVNIGDDFTAYSSGKIHIIGSSSSSLSTYASGLTGGTIAGSGIEVANDMKRDVQVTIGENANVYAYSSATDALLVSAEVGSKDYVVALIDDTVAGLVGISAAKAITNIANNQLVSLDKNSYYMALNGTVTISSNYGISYVNNKVDSMTAGLASGMTGKANTTIDIKSQMNINYSDVENEDTVYIVGQYANVLNYAKSWNVNNELLMSNNSVTGNVFFENELTVNLDVNTYISGCYIDGIEEGYLSASFMTPEFNNSSNFKSTNNAKISLAKISTDAIKNACTEFWSKSNSSVNGKVVMNIGTVELYSTSDNRYFVGSGYNRISGIVYTSNVDINSGGYTAKNVLASNFNAVINQRKNTDGYAFLFFKHISRNICVIDITDDSVTIHDSSNSVSISKNTKNGDTIYLGELMAYMASYSGYYKCALSDLYIINRSNYNLCFDIITNTNNSNYPRGTITAYSLSDKNISILGQHEDYQSYHLYADWIGEEGGYLNLGTSADVYIEVNANGMNVSGIASSYVTSSGNVITIDLSNLEGNYIEYSMNTTVSNCKNIIKSVQGIRSLVVHNTTNKEIRIEDITVDTYVHITNTEVSNTVLGNVKANAEVIIEFVKGGKLECDSIEAPVVSITGVDSLGTSSNPFQIQAAEKCAITLSATEDIYVLFTNTNRNIQTNDLSLDMESTNGIVNFIYLLNNGEYGLVRMDVKRIYAKDVDILFKTATLTQATTIQVSSSSAIDQADIEADTIKLHHENGLCRMEVGSEDTPFEIKASGQVTLNGLQKCYLTQLENDLELEFEKSKMTFFKNEEEYQEWKNGQTKELEFIFIVHVDGSLHINSLAAGVNNDSYALAYWDKVVLDVKDDLIIDNGDCMAIDLDVTCSRNFIVYGTLNMHKYLNDIVLDLSGYAYIENIEKINVLDITAIGSITIDGNVYVNSKLSLNSLTDKVEISGNLMQESVGSYYGAKDVILTAYSDISVGAINPNSRYKIVSLFGDVSILNSYNPSWISSTSTKLIDVEACNGSVSIFGNDVTYVNDILGGSIHIRAKDDIYYYARTTEDGDMEYGDILFERFFGEVFDVSSENGDVFIGNIRINSTIYYGNVSPGAVLSFTNNVTISSVEVKTSIAKITSTKNITVGSLSGKNSHYTVESAGDISISFFETETGVLKTYGTNVDLGTIRGGQLFEAKAENITMTSIQNIPYINIQADCMVVPTLDINASRWVTLNVSTLNISSITASTVEITSTKVAGTVDKPIEISASSTTFNCYNCYFDCTDRVVVRANDTIIDYSIDTDKDCDIRLNNVVFNGSITCKDFVGKIQNSILDSITANSIDAQFEDSKVSSMSAVGNISLRGSVELVDSITADSLDFKLKQSIVSASITAVTRANLVLNAISKITSEYIHSPVLSISIEGNFGSNKKSVDLGKTVLAFEQNYGNAYIHGTTIELESFTSGSNSVVYIVADKIEGDYSLNPNQKVSIEATQIELDMSCSENTIVYDTVLFFDCSSAKIALSGNQYIEMNFSGDALDITATILSLDISCKKNTAIKGSIATKEVFINAEGQNIVLSDFSVLSLEKDSFFEIKANRISVTDAKIALGNNDSSFTMEAASDITYNGSIDADVILIRGAAISGVASITSTKSTSILADSIELDGTVTGEEVSLEADDVIVQSIYADIAHISALDKVSGKNDSTMMLYGYNGKIVDLYLDIVYSTIFNVKEASQIILNVHGVLDVDSVDIIENVYDASFIYSDIAYQGYTLKLTNDVTLIRPFVISSQGLIQGIDFNGYSITGTVIVDEALSRTFVLKNGTMQLDSETEQPLWIINGSVQLSNMVIQNSLGAAVFGINGKLNVVSSSTIEGDIAISLRMNSTIIVNDMSVVATINGVEESYSSSSAISRYLVSCSATKLVFIGMQKEDGMIDIIRFIKPGTTITYDVSSILPADATIGFGDEYLDSSVSITYEQARSAMEAYMNSIDYDIKYRITYADGTTSSGIVTITLYDVTGGLTIDATYIYNDGTIPNSLDRLPIIYSDVDGYMVPMLKFRSKNEDGLVQSDGTFTNEMFKYYFDGCTFKFFYDEDTSENPDRLILEHTSYDFDEIFRPTQYVHGAVVVSLNPKEALDKLTSDISFENSSDGSMKLIFYIYVDHVPEAHIVEDYITYTPTFNLNEETGEVVYNTITIWDYLESYEVGKLADYCNVRVFVFGIGEMDPEFSVLEDGEYIALVEVYYGLEYTKLYFHFKVNNPTQYKITFIENGHERVEYHNPGEIIYGYGYDFVGYTFNGWYCDDVLNNHNISSEVYSSGKDQIIFDLTICVTSDMVFESRYVEGYADGVEVENSILYINGVETIVSMLSHPSQVYYAPEIEGYSFVRWMYYDSIDDTYYEMSTQEYEFLNPNETYRLEYAPIDVAVKIHGLSVVKKYNEEVTLYGYDRENQRFVGWYVNDKLVSTEFVYTFIVKEYVEVIAKYVDLITITVQSWTNSTIENVFVGETYTFTREELAERRFVGWYFDDVFVGDSDTIELTFENSGILEARYETKEYRVSMNPCNGVSISGNSTANHFMDYVALVSSSGCRLVQEENISVVMNGNEFTGYTLEDHRILMIPMDSIVGDIVITISMNLHTMKKQERVEPTCTSNGSIEYYICECGKYFLDEEGRTEISLEDTILPVQHTLVHVDGITETCTTNGNKAHDECTVCGKIFINGVEVTAKDLVIKAHHSFGEFIEASVSTCISHGFDAHYECSVCHKNFTIDGFEILDMEYPLVDHTITHVDAASETCTVNGNIAYDYCSVCGKKFVDGVETNDVEIAAHHTCKHVDAVTETCTTSGNKAYDECSVCGKKFVDGVETTNVEIAAHHTLAHITRVEATYTAEGILDHYACSSCCKYFDEKGNEITNIVIPMLKYPVVNNEVKTEVTASELEAGIDIGKQIEQAGSDALAIVIVAGEYSVSFDAKAVEELQKANGVLSMQVDENSTSYPEALCVIQISLSNATSFGDGYATIETNLVAQLAKGEYLAVYYVAEDGTRTLVESTYENNKLTFMTNHFSTYIVVVEKANTGLPAIAIIGIILGSVAVMGGAVFVVLRFTVLKKRKSINS